MTALQKAKLAAVDGKGKVSDEVDVQFNPASLKLNRSNSIDAGKSRGRQVQQYNGTSSTTLTLELEFDTADHDDDGDPVDVRSLTADVTRFVLPGGKESKQAPPRVRFSWGKVVLIGVMGSANEDLDLFSPEGVPLRAKVSVSIKEQDPKFEALENGAGANPSTSAPVSGTPAPTGPGSSGGGSGPADRVAEALDGESAADFLSRQGLIPEAWRSIADGVSDVLNLLPGEPIGFSLGGALGGFSVGGGELDLGGGLEVSLGLEAPAGSGNTDGGSGGGSSSGGSGAGGSGPDPAGFALAAAGGLTAAVQTAAAATAGQSADANRQAFAAPTSSPRTTGGPGAGGAGTGAQRPRLRLRDSGGIGYSSTPAAAAAPTPVAADRRAITYGAGLPLRDRITPVEVRLAGSPWVVIGARQPATEPVSAASGSSGCLCRSATGGTAATVSGTPARPPSVVQPNVVVPRSARSRPVQAAASNRGGGCGCR